MSLAQRFQRLPTIVEAMRVPPAFNDSMDNIMAHGAVVVWLQTNEVNFQVANKGEIDIVTLEGTMRALNGDWIVKGVAGEFFPVKPHVFKLNYKPI